MPDNGCQVRAGGLRFADIGTDLEIFTGRHRAEETPSLWYLRDSERYDLFRRESVYAAAREPDLAACWANDPRDSTQKAGFSCSVWPDDRDHLAFPDVNRHISDREGLAITDA